LGFNSFFLEINHGDWCVHIGQMAHIIMNLDEETILRLNGIRTKLEEHVLSTFNGNKMWYQENTLQIYGTVNLTTDEWGVHVNFVSENREPISLSGRWDVIIAYSNHLGAQYCGWSLDFECPYPEWEERNHDQ